MKKNMFLVTATLIGSISQAQRDTTALNEVVVTANRFAQKQNTSGKVVSVITREMLLRSSGKTLPELLNQQAGLTIIGSQNTLGTNQDVYMRGASAGKSLVLIDGVPAYDPSTINTAFELNHLSIDNIERIEIVRGAMSTLYGSDAIAGVINIITRKAGSKPAAFYGNLSAGSFNTMKTVGGVNGQLRNTRYNLQYSGTRSEGISAAYDSTDRNNFDKDGFIQNVVSANIAHNITPQLLVRANGQLGQYKTDLDAGAFQDEKDQVLTTRNNQAGAGLEYGFDRGGKLVFNYNFNSTERKYLDDSISVGGFSKFSRQRYVGRSHIAELYSSFDLGRYTGLLVGADYRFQNTDQHYFSLSSFGPYETKQGKDSVKMNQYSAFASVYLKELGGFHLEAGGRFNHHSEYGDNTTYTLNPSYLIGSHLKVFANLASAFKAPSLYQLYVIGAAPAQPLKAEKSTTVDGGVEYSNTALGIFARAVYFNREIRNGIEYNLVNDRYFNNNLQKDHGIELEANVKLGIVDLGANYTWVTGEVNTTKFDYDAANWSYKANGDTTYNNLFRRPEHTVNFTVGVAPAKNLYVSAHTRIAGKRFEPVYMSNPVAMDGYHTVDLYGEYRFSPAIKAFADLKNITNQRFFDVLGYNARRFNFMAGVNINL